MSPNPAAPSARLLRLLSLAACIAAASPLHALQTPVPTPKPAPGGSLPAGPCAPSIADQGFGGCLEASSIPTLGLLYPLSQSLYVDAASGWVGLGTTNPLARLTVLGDAFVAGDQRFNDINDGIRFTSYNPFFAASAPMMTMFDSGTVNPDRMVLAHSPLYPTWGLEYQDAGDEFVFQRMAGDPTLTVDLGSREVKVNGDVSIVGSVSQAYFECNGQADISATGTAPTLTVRGNDTDQVSTAYITSKAHGSPPWFEILTLYGATPSPGGAGGPATGYQFLTCQHDLQTYFRVSNPGDVYADGAFTGPADFAEMMQVGAGPGSVEASDLLMIDPTGHRAVVLATEPRSRLVAGVYSTEPGFVGSAREWDLPPDEGGERSTYLDRADMARLYGEVPVAVVGIVPVKASSENGPIRPGDLLVSSSTPGHVMRDDAPAIGTVVGKALDTLDDARGVIEMLVTLQ